jgi:hypothetical protein
MTKATLLPTATLPEGEQQFLRPDEATVYTKEKWGIVRKPRSWREMRRNGTGPRYRRSGNTVVYTPQAIDEWVLQKFSIEWSSTSEEAASRLMAGDNRDKRDPFSEGGEHT